MYLILSTKLNFWFKEFFYLKKFLFKIRKISRHEKERLDTNQIENINQKEKSNMMSHKLQKV